LLQGTSCDPAQAGTTTDIFTNQQGCDSLVITTTIFQAKDTTLLQGTSCDPAQAGTTTDIFTNQQGCDSLVITTTIYQASDTTLLQSTSCDPGQAGTTTDLFTNQQGCDSLVITTTIYQASDTTTLQGTSCDPGQAGTSTDLLTNQEGCDSLVITTITLLPSTRDTLIELTCQLQDTSTTVINLTNQAGCDSIIVRIIEWTGSDSCILEIGMEVTQPRCIGDSGEIRLDVTAGTFPIEVSWSSLNGDGQTITLSNADPLTILSGLSPGIYTLFAIDANGQTWQDTVTILSGQQFSIDLGNDLQVPAGTIVDLNLQVNPQTTVLQSILWEPDLCTFCTDPSILVEEEITVRVTVESDIGCVGNDQINIRVNETTNRRVYIPNVFSPNDDGINDLFTIYGNDEVLGVQSLAIYDRWGNELYRRESLTVNDPSVGWDGTFRGNLMDAAVFVYVAEVVLRSGEIRLYKGEVTLMR
jgi:gliding motility-associated-like protein